MPSLRQASIPRSSGRKRSYRPISQDFKCHGDLSTAPDGASEYAFKGEMRLRLTLSVRAFSLRKKKEQFGLRKRYNSEIAVLDLVENFRFAIQARERYLA